MNTDPKVNAGDVLLYLEKNGSIDLSGVVAEMNKAKRKQILQEHPYAISQGKDGRWRTYVPDATKANGRRQIAKSTLNGLQEAIVETYENCEDNNKYRNITVAQLYPEWLEYKKLHTKSASYIYRIGTEWNKHYENSSIVKCPIISLTKLHLDEWAHELIKNNDMTRKQYYNTTLIMRQVMEYALEREIISVNLFARVKPDAKLFRKTPKKPSETQVYTKAEENAFEKKAWDDFNKRKHYKHQLVPLAMLFLFQSGLRLSELCTLRYEDIQGDEIQIKRMYLDFNGEIVDRTKSDAGERPVILTKKGMDIIEAARQRQIDEGVSDNGYIFSMTDKPCPYGEIRKTFARYCKAIDITNKSSHKVRKTYISTLIDAGVSINTIRELVGHADERTTYNSYCFDRLDKSERKKLIENALS